MHALVEDHREAGLPSASVENYTESTHLGKFFLVI